MMDAEPASEMRKGREGEAGRGVSPRPRCSDPGAGVPRLAENEGVAETCGQR